MPLGRLPPLLAAVFVRKARAQSRAHTGVHAALFGVGALRSLVMAERLHEGLSVLLVLGRIAEATCRGPEKDI